MSCELIEATEHGAWVQNEYGLSEFKTLGQLEAECPSVARQITGPCRCELIDFTPHGAWVATRCGLVVVSEEFYTEAQLADRCPMLYRRLTEPY